jgi:hypothetical protein
MCKQYEENRRELTDLIYEKRSFTKGELVDEFVRRTGGATTHIGGPNTVASHLEELREYRILRRIGDRYEVIAR